MNKKYILEIILEARENGANELVLEHANFADLPDEFWQLENLTSLEINDCYNLENISAKISQLINLKSLKITRSRISSFPQEFCLLENLSSLEISGCWLESIPAKISQLINLKSLKIIESEISSFPKEFWQLENLTSLELIDFWSLENIPAKISQLTNLKSFKITRSRIASFPREFWQLVNLRSLEILVCPFLETIPAESGLLTNLTSLRIIGCKSLGDLPKEIGKLTNLTSLAIISCEGLENLPEEIGKLINLTSIRIKNCGKIKLPSAIYTLPNLTFLEIENNCEIHESSFPQNVPIDIEGALRVINMSGDTIALFFGYDLLKLANKFASPEGFCAYYDQLYDDYCAWDNAGINLTDQAPEEQEEDYKKVLQGLKCDTIILMRIKVRGYDFLLQKLTRLTYPYHCQVKKIENSIDQIKGTISCYFDDIQVLRKASELGLVEQKYLMQEIIRTGWIYEHPEYWFTNNNIDAALEYSAENKNTELVAFLLDYKHKHIPV